LSIIVLFIVSIIAFFLVRLVPGGDPARAMLGLDASPQEVATLQHQMWLDRPLLIQYTHWIGGILHGDLGTSFRYQSPVRNLIGARLPVTAYLAGVALIFSAIIGIAAGVISAVTRGSLLDQIISILANMGMAIPVFFLGILGIYIFGLDLGWLPISGFTSPFTDFGHSTRQIVMPVFCMGLTTLAVMTRQTRSAMLEVVRQDYIRTARAKGLTQQTIILQHALKNAFIPIITLFGLAVPSLIAGSVLVETVFNIPGMGRLIVNAVINKDYPIVQAGIVIIATLIVIVNLVVDISYGWIDPRIRFH